MDEEFQSLIVTNPDIVDEGIDVSGLRTTTDTSPFLLGNIPDYSGIQYSTLAPTKYTDLMRLYSSGLPTTATDTAQIPGAVDTLVDVGSGDGGQATIPTDDFNQQEFEENLIDQGVGLQIAPGQPVVAPGEVPVTNLDLAIDNDPMLGVVDVDGEGEFGGLDEGADPDRIQANEFADIESPTGIGPTYDEAGLPDTSIPDRDRGQIPTSTDEFDVTTDQFTRPTMADVAGPTDFTEAPITIQQTVMDGQPIDPEYDIEAIPLTTAAPSNIVMAKDPEGVVDPFDGKYTMSTAITPEDTTESAVDKIKNALGLDNLDIPGAIIDTAINTITGKTIDGLAPITLVYDLGKKLFEEQKQKTAVREAAEEQARQDRIDEAAAITRRIEEEDRQRRETEAAEAAAARAREEAAVEQAAIEREKARIAEVTRQNEIRRQAEIDRLAAEARERAAQNQGGGNGGGQGDQSGGRSSSSGESEYGGFCFDPNTRVQMADGSDKKIKEIQLGDNTKGGEVTGVFQFKATDEIHNYKGVTVAGSHYVKEDGKFIMVQDSPLAVKIDKIPVVYSLDTTGRRIFIKDIEFADYNGDGVAKNFLNNAGIDLTGFDKEVLRQVQQRLI